MVVIRLVSCLIAVLGFLPAACDRAPSAPAPKPHKSSTVQTGEASIYSTQFAGRKTANGEKLKLDDMTAASRTLPLGTHAQVTNKETGQTATVRINDRGPYVGGRVMDLTPKAAKHIGIDRTDGVAAVTVRPIDVPATDH